MWTMLITFQRCFLHCRQCTKIHLHLYVLHRWNPLLNWKKKKQKKVHLAILLTHLRSKGITHQQTENLWSTYNCLWLYHTTLPSVAWHRTSFHRKFWCQNSDISHGNKKVSHGNKAHRKLSAETLLESFLTVFCSAVLPAIVHYIVCIFI